ncbi:MAG TPA: ABC transporter substrate-binding protein, partial [Cupriavidus sp.]|nr:ABC transporter substrate-binding protein [Cupriavidus sp.]
MRPSQPAALFAASIVSVTSMAFAASAAHAADSYPTKPIRWIVPYAAGGGSDFLARTIGQGLSAKIGQPVVV